MRDTTQARQDRRFRESLEKRSIDEGRVDVAGSLNRLAVQDGIQQSAGDILTKLRAAAQGRRRTVNDLNSKHDAYLAKSAFNRPHPSSLARAEADFRPRPSQERDTEGTDPPYRERFVTPVIEGRTYDRVKDADGSMRADGRTRADKWDGQGGRNLGLKEMAEELRLTVEQMRALATARVVASRYF